MPHFLTVEKFAIAVALRMSRGMRGEGTRTDYSCKKPLLWHTPSFSFSKIFFTGFLLSFFMMQASRVGEIYKLVFPYIALGKG